MRLFVIRALAIPVAALCMALLCVATACSGGVHRQAVDVDETGWDEPLTWVFDNHDTATVMDVAFGFEYVSDIDATLLAGSLFIVEVEFPLGGRFESAVSPVVNASLGEGGVNGPSDTDDAVAGGDDVNALSDGAGGDARDGASGGLLSRMVASPGARFDQRGKYTFTLTPLQTTVGVRRVALELVP